MSDIQIVGFGLILIRVSAFLAFFSVFGSKNLPTPIKVGLAFALALFWSTNLDLPAGYLTGFTDKSAHWLPFVLAGVKEFMVGVLLAIALGTMLIPLKIGGSYIGQEMGLSMAAISDPGAQDSSGIASKFLESIGVIAFFAFDMHHFVILALEHSFLGIGLERGMMDLSYESMINHLCNLSSIGLGIIAPVGILLFLVLAGLALINKASPAMNLFSIGLTLRTGLGILCLTIFLPGIMEASVLYFEHAQFELENFIYGVQP